MERRCEGHQEQLPPKAGRRPGRTSQHNTKEGTASEATAAPNVAHVRATPRPTERYDAHARDEKRLLGRDTWVKPQQTSAHNPTTPGKRRFPRQLSRRANTAPLALRELRRAPYLGADTPELAAAPSYLTKAGTHECVHKQEDPSQPNQERRPCEHTVCRHASRKRCHSYTLALASSPGGQPGVAGAQVAKQPSYRVRRSPHPNNAFRATGLSDKEFRSREVCVTSALAAEWLVAALGLTPRARLAPAILKPQSAIHIPGQGSQRTHMPSSS